MESKSDFDSWNRTRPLKSPSKWQLWQLGHGRLVTAVISGVENAFQMNLPEHWNAGVRTGKKGTPRPTAHSLNRLWRCTTLPVGQGPHTEQTPPSTLKYSAILNLISITDLHEEALCSQAEILIWRPRSGKPSLTASSLLLTPPYRIIVDRKAWQWIKHPLKRGTKFPQILINTRPKMPDHLHGSTVYKNLYSRKQHFYSMTLFCHWASPYSLNLISTLSYSLAHTMCPLQKLYTHLLSEAGQTDLTLPTQSQCALSSQHENGQAQAVANTRVPSIAISHGFAAKRSRKCTRRLIPLPGIRDASPRNFCH